MQSSTPHVDAVLSNLRDPIPHVNEDTGEEHSPAVAEALDSISTLARTLSDEALALAGRLSTLATEDERPALARAAWALGLAMTATGEALTRAAALDLTAFKDASGEEGDE